MDLGKYITILGISAIKFMGGPLAAAGWKLAWWPAYACAVVGMMLTVSTIVLAGHMLEPTLQKWAARRKKKRKVFTRLNRWAVWVKQRVGLWGIAFLTPPLFTPPLGASLAMAFGYRKIMIISSMLVSALVWGGICMYAFYYLRHFLPL